MKREKGEREERKLSLFFFFSVFLFFFFLSSMAKKGTRAPVFPRAKEAISLVVVVTSSVDQGGATMDPPDRWPIMMSDIEKSKEIQR